MDKFDFMNIIQDILDETQNDLLLNKGEELKNIIDMLVKKEIEYARIGIR